MGTRYTNEEPEDVADLSREILAGLEEGCRERDLETPGLIVEPGRAIASGSALTLYGVGSLKEVPGIRSFVAVDGGMSDNIRPALYGSRYTIALASRSSDAADRTVTIVGRHCETGDELARDVSLPGDLRRGDLLAFASTGAYEYAMSSNYNKVGRPAVVAVSDGGVRLIARRETYDDLARLDED
jgi:diaminopimelate decarboxylase